MDNLYNQKLIRKRIMANTVQSLWIGEKLSKVAQLCIKSFLKNGNPFHLYTYDSVEGIPEGTTILDANTILSKDLIFTSHNGSVAHFADWFRWKMLEKQGGIWVDMDLIAVKQFDFKEEILFGFESPGVANVSFLKFPASHKLPTFMAKICESPNTFLPYDSFETKKTKLIRRLTGNKRSNTAWGEAGGPKGFTDALNHFRLMEFGKSFLYFYPISYMHWQTLFDETLYQKADLLNHSYAIHLWNEFLRLNKDFQIEKKSLFTELLQQYDMQ